MKVVIFAGGLGTRLSSITDYIPKPMVRIGGKPILWHIMKIYSTYGFNDFILCLGYKQEVIKEYFYNYNFWSADFEINLNSKKIKILNSYEKTDWEITLVDTGANALKGARLKKVEKYLDDGPNMFTYGDGVADIDIKELVKFHRSHKKILTITGVNPPSRFGEMMTEGSRVISFKEKPQISSGLINGGFCVFNRNLLKYLTKDDNCDLEDRVFEKLASRGQVMVYKHLKNWGCIDTEQELRYLNNTWDENKAFWKVWE
ncbi:glucose-1-phosphate cytidylyltransferase [Candidatus Woesebacteria bacterium RIFCSPHIGHO2_12_FULL_42_9]|uniref:Glucose-1-phosphate cytidylyltransferase n=3 Tax=Candidatus Woeseibacteriota TaxID=1752722 RepID=A0A1F8AUI2_9BACT|nr:MAG: glucose-1-phosphate cytidylyltransferase [Candidatus Woesebacteria bacterium GWA1_42_12]OGM07852.1 MAG: glucose-1-phosphate cytidylyltransferase [Candidatus Woesebacteria bacterium GWC1_42_13]OGM55397.1 MAG: glucose-1-phosphate cytidylyltransferase [Candidatus Woesebacteria bacterium RIFCSPHIGHO2_12_FULL_42_9]